METAMVTASNDRKARASRASVAPARKARATNSNAKAAAVANTSARTAVAVAKAVITPDTPAGLLAGLTATVPA